MLIWGQLTFLSLSFLTHEMGITAPFLRVLVGCWEEAMRELAGTVWMWVLRKGLCYDKVRALFLNKERPQL